VHTAHGPLFTTGWNWIQAHNTVIHEDSVETVTNRLLQELGRNGGVDTSRDGTDNLSLLANDRLDARILCLYEPIQSPVLASLANLHGKVADELLALRSVSDLGVELNSAQRLLRVSDTSEGRALPVAAIVKNPAGRLPSMSPWDIQTSIWSPTPSTSTWGAAEVWRVTVKME
jgi:hypothetical protein